MATNQSMLGGCFVCLDEHGWADNPLVYCDGKACSVAVHQACYGITTVPTGPWYCKVCEAKQVTDTTKCSLCPYLGGAFKITDTNEWAHVVCALYIPEIQFDDVSTMEPIVVKSIPEERFTKLCYICEEKERPENTIAEGACMSCAKAGCKLSFHVTCGQVAGLLCEEAWASNTTKYCGYCSQHIPKSRKRAPLTDAECRSLYKMPVQQTSESSKTGGMSDTPKPPKLIKMINEVSDDIVNSKEGEENHDNVVADSPNSDVDAAPVESTQQELQKVASTLSQETHATLSDAKDINMTKAVTRKRKEAKRPVAQKSTQRRKKQSTIVKERIQKPTKRGGKFSQKKLTKEHDSKQTELNKSGKSNSEQTEGDDDSPPPSYGALLEDVGYASAPKHSVISLSTFGQDSLEPSDPMDIGLMKLTPMSQSIDIDGLAAIEQLLQQQKDDFMQFIVEFGSPPKVSSSLKSLSKLRDENSLLEESINKLAYRRDQLLAIKARLSVPHTAHQFPTAVNPTSNIALTDSKPFP